MRSFTKQPKDSLDYDIVLTDWLTDDDEIVDVSVTAPTGIELTGRGISPDRVKFWIKGGTSGNTYQFSPLIITQKREFEVDFFIIVREL